MLRLVLQRKNLRHTPLHLKRQFIRLDHSLQLTVPRIRPLLKPPIRLLQKPQLLHLLRLPPHPVPQVRHPTPTAHPRTLKRRRQKRRPIIHRSPQIPNRIDRHKPRQILCHRPQPIRHPRPHRRPHKHLIARVNRHHRLLMPRILRRRTVDQTQLVRLLRQLWKRLRNHEPTLPPGLELKLRHQIRRPHLRQLRLPIKGVQMTRPPIEEHKNHPLRLRRMMRHLRCQRILKPLPLLRQRRKRQPSKPHPRLLQHRPS